MNDMHTAVSWIGAAGAMLTTLCWLPQAVRVIRYKDTRAISLTTNLMLVAGVVCWLIYGIALNDWPLICSNIVTMGFTVLIIAMKLRHG
jgi:MtN3 and saliva related transmembrane protein